MQLKKSHSLSNTTSIKLLEIWWWSVGVCVHLQLFLVLSSKALV